MEYNRDAMQRYAFKMRLDEVYEGKEIPGCCTETDKEKKEGKRGANSDKQRQK